MPVAPLSIDTPGVLDPRLADLGGLVRAGSIRLALAGLTHLSSTPASTPLDRRGRAELVTLTVECLLAQGSTTLAVGWGAQVEDLVVGHGAPSAWHARGELASAQDDHEQAVDCYRAAGSAEADAETPPQPLIPWRSGAALALVRCGRRREAGDLAAAEHAQALDRGDAHDLARALRTLATTAADGRALARLEEARDLLGADRSRRLAAQIATDLAGLLILTGDAGRARGLLRGAELYAAREDLWPLQSRVRRLLLRLGETPLRLEDEALSILTQGERRVAVLALDGLTNRQIAEQLVVSVKAVEGHLSKIYRKLGVSSRSALCATIGDRT